MGEAAALVREGLLVVAMVGGPLFAALLVSGLVTGILQAITQVNDPAVGMVPRLAVAAATLWLSGGWMLDQLARHFARAAIALQAAGR